MMKSEVRSQKSEVRSQKSEVRTIIRRTKACQVLCAQFDMFLSGAEGLMKKALFALIPALLFASCKFWNEPIEEFFSYWSAEAYVTGSDVKVPAQRDSSGVTSIASGADADILLSASNPKSFRFIMPTAGNSEMIKFTGLSAQPVPGTDYSLTQVSSDTLKLTYKSAFLKTHEWGTADFGAELTLYADDGRKFVKPYVFNLKANTPPPTPSFVLAKTTSSGKYVLCLQVPDMDVSCPGGTLHQDIAKISIDGTEYDLKVNGTKDDFVKPGSAKFIGNTAVEQLTGSPAVPSGKWILYYETEVPVGGAYHEYQVFLTDEMGLVSGTIKAGTATNEAPAANINVKKGESVASTDPLIGTSNGNPILIKEEISIHGAEIEISNVAGTTHCTVTENGTQKSYEGTSVIVQLALNEENEKLYELEYYTDGEGYKPSAHKTVYYKVLKRHTVTFNAKEGMYADGANIYTVNAAHTLPVTKPATSNSPTRKGYIFDGTWYKDTACSAGQEWNFETDTVTSDITLYAKWNPASGTGYKVEHYQEKTDGVGQYPASPHETDNLTGTTGANISVTLKTYPGFELDKQEPVSPSIAADGSTVVKVYYKRESITVTFKLDGGTIDSSTANVTRTGRFGTALTPPSPVKTGYTFNSWQPVEAAPLLSSTFPASDAAYTAQWVANTNTPYKVKHLKQDVTGSGYTEVAADRQTLQGTTDAAPTVTPKTYTGFQAGSYTPTTIAADGSTVVEVKYDRVQYTVTFNANGGTPAPSNKDVRHEAKVTEPSTMSKTGYTFGGWYKSSTYTGAAWNFASDQVISYTNLYAKWTANTYKVHFDGNGHTGGSMPDQTFTYDEASKPLSQNTFTKTDYRFTGWATSSSGSKMYDNQQSVNNLTTTNGGVVNLYAVWVPLPKVRFKVEGGIGGKLKCTYDGTTQEASGNTEKYFIVEYDSISKNATFTAVPDSGWALDEWHINPGPFNDGSQSTDLQRAVTRIVSDVTVTVKFRH